MADDPCLGHHCYGCVDTLDLRRVLAGSLEVVTEAQVLKARNTPTRTQFSMLGRRLEAFR